MEDFGLSNQEMKKFFANANASANEFKETLDSLDNNPAASYSFSNIRLGQYRDMISDVVEIGNEVFDITHTEYPDYPVINGYDPDFPPAPTYEPTPTPTPTPDTSSISELFNQLEQVMNQIRSTNNFVNTIVNAVLGNTNPSTGGGDTPPEVTEGTFTNAQLRSRNSGARQYVQTSLNDIKTELLAQGYNSAKLDEAIEFLTELYEYRISNAISAGEGITISKAEMKEYILNYFRSGYYSTEAGDVKDLQTLNTWVNGCTRTQSSTKDNISDAKALAKTWVVNALLAQLRDQLKNLGLDASKVDSAYNELVNDYTSWINGVKEKMSSAISGIRIEYSSSGYKVTYNEKEIANRFKHLLMYSSNSSTTQSGRNGSGTRNSGTRSSSSPSRTGSGRSPSRSGSGTGRTGSGTGRTGGSSSPSRSGGSNGTGRPGGGSGAR